ncbi:Replication factor C subunit 1 [Cryptotermes secundus]|uniref:Replication factor C subunit 1 n=1 Tax=Cryptotermes secundus TaxID=105785 RepID=A0A2J7QPY6_9NEOP|nr:replication factor C subunit 1 [Cryptotermes secundus]PNF30645.1 Replication factor C subunit 1 [Cryptotermes secundus]
MSHDIRSYFPPKAGSEAKGKCKEMKVNVERRHRKRQLVCIDSDSDEDILPSQVKKHERKSGISVSCVRGVTQKNSKSISKPELKPIDVADVFGNSQIKRTASKKDEVKKVMKNVTPQLENLHSDSEFVGTLQELDERKNFCKKENEITPVKEKQKHALHTSEFSKSALDSYKIPRNAMKETPNKTDIKLLAQKEESRDKETTSLISQPETSPDLPKKIKGNEYLSTENGTQQEKAVRSPASVKRCDISSDEDVYERKRQHAMQYQRYLQREGPKNPGGKEVPQGRPGCLSGLVFVVTGVLETIDREETSSLIKQCGGRVTSSVSRNTNYLVVGEEPGPAKIEKAAKLNTPHLTEDELFALIRARSCLPDTERLSKDSEEVIKKDEKIKHKDNLSRNDITHGTRIETSKSIKKNIKKEETEMPVLEKQDISLSPPSARNTTFQRHSLWADKYKPVSTKHIIGQQGDRSNVKKLIKWLQSWHSNHSGKKKLVRPSPWAKDETGSYFKAALLSGPPGVGKTTTAHLVCEELGFDVVEFNASDTRSKKLLHEEVSELLNNKSLSGYFQGAAGRKPTENHVLIMDEVDGMAGNEDRGGMQELIQLIKSSRVPVICMCNDRHHPKIRSLTNYCFDLQFSRPSVKQIGGAMMSICFKEGIKMSPETLNDIITGTNHDVRQVLHHLSVWSVKDKQLSFENIKEESLKAKKDVKLGPWDVVKKVFSADVHKSMSIHDKSDLFFHDYSLGPLFVQENYLGVMPHKSRNNRKRHLELVAQTAESLSSGDMVEKTIRSKSAWSLLPAQAIFSSVLPGDLLEGHFTCQINFPAWLGKNSRRSKFQRLLQELHGHMRLNISGSKEAVNLDYMTHLRDAISGPLIKDGVDGVPATLHVMQDYYLLREDIDSLMELSLWPNQKDPMSLVDSKVKAALTHRFNKGGIMTPYSIVKIKNSASKSSQDLEFDGDEQDVGEEEEEEEGITRDAMIKVKKRNTTTQNPAPGRSGAKRRKVDNKEVRKKNDKHERK